MAKVKEERKQREADMATVKNNEPITEILMPSKEKLEEMYGKIMDDPAITFISDWREPNYDDKFDESSFFVNLDEDIDSFIDNIEIALCNAGKS